MTLSKSDTYRIYKTGNSLWSLVILHGANEELIRRDLRIIFNNLKGIKVPISAPSLMYMKFHIEKSNFLKELLLPA